jgi:hypothetical protein
MNDQSKLADDDCTVPGDSIPPEELRRYSVDRDPDSEEGIASYVEGQAPDEVVKHVELVKTEYVAGMKHEVWDVTTDADRYWVITNLTNLYSQRHFQSLDYTLSFHVGLMMRMRSRPDGAMSDDPSPFDDAFRRQEQVKDRYDRAIETEDLQAIGMQLRECLLSLITAVRRRVELQESADRPRDADFVGWTDLLTNELCPGGSNKTLRQYMKGIAKETWQLVSWLTHHRNATEAATSIALHGCDTVIGHFVQLVERKDADPRELCPLCQSRDLRQHYDPFLEPDGDYYLKCAACSWSSHPENGDQSSATTGGDA